MSHEDAVLHGCHCCGNTAVARFNMHDPRTKENYYLCSDECVRALDMSLKVARRLAKEFENVRMEREARAQQVAMRLGVPWTP